MTKKRIIICTIILVAITTLLAFSPWNWSIFKNTPVYSQAQLQQKYDSGVSQGLAEQASFNVTINDLKQDIQNISKNLTIINEDVFNESKTKQELLNKIAELEAELELAQQEGYVDNKIASIEQQIVEIKSELTKLEELKRLIVKVTTPTLTRLSSGNIGVGLTTIITKANANTISRRLSKKLEYYDSTTNRNLTFNVAYWTIKVSAVTYVNWYTGETSTYEEKEYTFTPDNYYHDDVVNPYYGRSIEYIPHFDFNVEYGHASVVYL